MKIITVSDIISITYHAGINCDKKFFFDEFYAIPTREWIENEFSESLKMISRELGVDTYSREANDCDDFARFAASWAQMLNQRTRREYAAALGFGVFSYYTSKGGLHGINIVMLNNDEDQVEPFFYKPQITRFIELTDSEKYLCINYLF